jgi:L-glyceraldehyde 3-phosphate reductase
VLRHERVTSAIVGASTGAQLDANLDTLDNPEFCQAELDAIDKALTG